MSTSVGMTKTENVTGKSAARHNVIKLGFWPATCKRLPAPLVGKEKNQISNHYTDTPKKKNFLKTRV